MLIFLNAIVTPQPWNLLAGGHARWDDPIIIWELYLNAQSDSLINQITRASLQADAGDCIDQASKRQKLDLPTAEEMAALERPVNLDTQLEVCNCNSAGTSTCAGRKPTLSFGAGTSRSR